MCLKVTSPRLIAKKDIICYKRILMLQVFNEELIQNNYKEAEEFSGEINNIQCHGKIHYEDNYVFFCTDEIKLNGSSCSDKLGYRYSWILDYNVTKLNKFSDPVLEYYTPYQAMNIKIGETYVGKLEEPNNGNEINIGFHAYTIKIRGCNVKCIIPKGSEYYLGIYNEIVSNCIMYKELIKK